MTKKLTPEGEAALTRYMRRPYTPDWNAVASAAIKASNLFTLEQVASAMNLARGQGIAEGREQASEEVQRLRAQLAHERLEWRTSAHADAQREQAHTLHVESAAEIKRLRARVAELERELMRASVPSMYTAMDDAHEYCEHERFEHNDDGELCLDCGELYVPNQGPSK